MKNCIPTRWSYVHCVTRSVHLRTDIIPTTEALTERGIQPNVESITGGQLRGHIIRRIEMHAWTSWQRNKLPKKNVKDSRQSLVLF